MKRRPIDIVYDHLRLFPSGEVARALLRNDLDNDAYDEQPITYICNEANPITNHKTDIN